MIFVELDHGLEVEDRRFKVLNLHARVGTVEVIVFVFGVAIQSVGIGLCCLLIVLQEEIGVALVEVGGRR